jgi:divalent metal cation (Fe/Co/Zn/Cd) transporter
MFLVEGGAGVMAHSTSLLADALDMLGDALVYGFSLFVLARSAHWQAGAALAKGGLMLADSIVGLLITVAIFWFVGQSGTIGKLLAQVDGTR